MSTDWLKELIRFFNGLAPPGTFFSEFINIKALLAILLVSLVCGAVGSLVVGNRMAFFSDALSHCVFAGAAFGVLAGVLVGAAGPYYEIGVPLVMVAFGVAMGLGIGMVREQTGLSNDTVIGVFFAGSIGLGALFSKFLRQYSFTNLEQFVWGNPNFIPEVDLLLLAGLAVVTSAMLMLMNNQLLFSTFNLSLARSRNVPVRLCNFCLLVLLAMIVNLSLRTVGALLINALLIVPAATACNLCSNMRQMFWTSVGISVGTAVAGLLLSWELLVRDIQVGIGGAIVVLNVLAFFVSMVVGPRLRGKRALNLR